MSILPEIDVMIEREAEEQPDELLSLKRENESQLNEILDLKQTIQKQTEQIKKLESQLNEVKAKAIQANDAMVSH